jgi:hypothetical protein
VIECDSDISPELIFLDRKDPNLGNLHRDPLLDEPDVAPVEFFLWAFD